MVVVDDGEDDNNVQINFKAPEKKSKVIKLLSAKNYYSFASKLAIETLCLD